MGMGPSGDPLEGFYQQPGIGSVYPEPGRPRSRMHPLGAPRSPSNKNICVLKYLSWVWFSQSEGENQWRQEGLGAFKRMELPVPARLWSRWGAA
jgi:hypothetical protein